MLRWVDCTAQSTSDKVARTKVIDLDYKSTWGQEWDKLKIAPAESDRLGARMGDAVTATGKTGKTGYGGREYRGASANAVDYLKMTIREFPMSMSRINGILGSGSNHRSKS